MKYIMNKAPFEVTHPFFNQGKQNLGMFAEHVYKDTYSLEDLEQKIVSLVQNTEYLEGLEPSTVIGDGWESYDEIFHRTFGLDKRINFTDITVCKTGQRGIDFYGKDLEGNPRTGQSKFVGQDKVRLPLEDINGMKEALCSCMIASQNEFNVNIKAHKNIYVFTNAKEIGRFTSEELLYNKVQCIGRAQIKEMTDNNPAFWDNARKCIENSVINVNF